MVVTPMDFQLVYDLEELLRATTTAEVLEVNLVVLNFRTLI